MNFSVNGLQGLGGWIMFASVTMMLLTVIVNVGFAIGVGKDALRLHQKEIGTVLVGKAIWVIATLLGGVFAATLYWLVHHSGLATRSDGEERVVAEPFDYRVPH